MIEGPSQSRPSGMISCSLFRPYPSYSPLLLSPPHSSCSHQPPNQVIWSGHACGSCEQLDRIQGRFLQHNETPAVWSRGWHLRSNRTWCCCILERYKQEEGRGESARRRRRRRRRRKRENEKLNYDTKTTPCQQQLPEKDESETEGLVSLKACPLNKVIIPFFHLSTYCDVWCDMWGEEPWKKRFFDPTTSPLSRT